MENMEREEGVVVLGRAEIDTRAPFQSVKEAVTLFGERVLAGEIYANKLKEMQSRGSEHGQHSSRVGAATAELEETKQSLQKAQEEGHLMAYCLKSLKQELEQTKRELQQLKKREIIIEKQKPPIVDPEIEDLKFIENASKVEVNNKPQMDQEGSEYFEKKRSVKFASPPSLAQVITSSKDVGEVVLPETSTPPNSKVQKMKRKPLIPLIAALFSKKKGLQGVESPRV